MPGDVDPLAGLDDIDWAQLHHAYGAATDVPALLRAVQANDRSLLPEEWRGERGALTDILSNAISHQGGTSPAGAKAIPFMIRLAADPATRGDRAALLVDAGFAAEGFLDQPWTTRARPGDHARAAIGRSIDTLISLLTDRDAAVRIGSCYAITCGCLNRDRVSDRAAHAVRDRLASETDDLVRAGMLLTLAWIDPGDKSLEVSQSLLDPRDTATSWAAAVCVVAHNPESVAEDAREIAMHGQFVGEDALPWISVNGFEPDVGAI